MNWYRAKTILIVFFVCMNIFLLANLIYSTNKANVVTPEIIKSTVEILEKNNISINSELIPEKTMAMDTVEMRNVFSNKENFAKTLCGNDAKSYAPDTYIGSAGDIKFDGDKFIFTPKKLELGDEGAELAENVQILLADFGIDVSYAECIEHSEKENKVLKFENEANKYKIFDSYIKVKLNSADNVTEIEGVWFEADTKTGGKISLKSVTGVLIDFILRPERPEGKNVIEKLELGYTASDANVYHETTVLIPVWQITLSDGNVFCIDTRE